MIIISARRDFIDSDEAITNGQFGAHMVREVNLETDQINKNPIYLSSWVQGLNKNARICILVHGYNNNFHEVCDSYHLIDKQIQTTMPGAYDHVVGYTWPGEDNFLEWYQAKSNANGAGRKFRMLINQMPASFTVDVISHSLGARVVLKALKDRDSTSIKCQIRNYFCMAGAVDNEVLEAGEEFSAALLATKRLFVLHSARDQVLSGAYRIAEIDNPIGLYGPEDKACVDRQESNIYVANCKRVVANHGGYKRSVEVFKYLKDAINQNPVNRFETL
jgi:esterase/lipase superfamily enzyme